MCVHIGGHTGIHLLRTCIFIFVPLQVSQLFFGPQLDHFPWVVFAKAVSKPKLAGDIFFSIFKHQYRGFIDFYGKMLVMMWLRRLVPTAVRMKRTVFYRMIDVGLFSCRDAALNSVYGSSIYHLEKYDSRSRVQNLLHSCTVRLVGRHILAKYYKQKL